MVDYLRELERRLRGPVRVRADLLAEARDSLLDAAEAYRRAGLDAGEAERRAVADFGAVEEVAPSYQTELALAQGRRTAGLLLAMPLLTVVWALVWWSKPTAGGQAPAVAVLAGRVWDGVALACLVGAGVAVVATGRGLRRIRAPRRIARLTGVAALAAGTVAAALWVPLVALAPRQAINDLTAWPPVAAAWLCSAAVTVAMIGSARRCLAVAARG